MRQPTGIIFVQLLNYCGPSACGPVQGFEVLELRTPAGEPSSITNLVARRLLPRHS
jgi:hypothetical protein